MLTWVFWMTVWSLLFMAAYKAGKYLVFRLTRRY